MCFFVYLQDVYLHNVRPTHEQNVIYRQFARNFPGPQHIVTLLEFTNIGMYNYYISEDWYI